MHAMRSITAKRLLLGSIVILILGMCAAGIWSSVWFCHGLSVQQETGKKFLDTLSSGDMQAWISRADGMLAMYTNLANQGIDIPVPDELQVFQIKRIVVIQPDYVGFMWVGGFDHTGLIVRKGANGMHTVTAMYDDNNERQLYGE